MIYTFQWKRTVRELEVLAGPQGEVICPVLRRELRPRRKRNRQPVVRELPLFMGYVAVRLSPGLIWPVLLQSRGVVGVLRVGEAPLLAKRESLRGMLQRSGITDSWEGAKVEFLEGPFRGRSGTFRDGRVEIEVFGRRVRAAVSTYSLMRLG